MVAGSAHKNIQKVDEWADKGLITAIKQVDRCGFETFASCSGLKRDHKKIELTSTPYMCFTSPTQKLINDLDKAKWKGLPLYVHDDVNGGFVKLPKNKFENKLQGRTCVYAQTKPNADVSAERAIKKLQRIIKKNCKLES